MSQHVSIGNYVYNPKRIGRGSFSMVYQGYHKDTGVKVAIKEIEIRSLRDMLERLKSEIEVMRNLEHINIVKLYDVIYDETDTYAYLILEYCSGGDLSKFLDGKPMKEKWVRVYIKQLAAGMRYMISKKIIHRDIKPQNILLTKDNILKLTDFGFARYFDVNTIVETLCGSPLYMAPEIMKYKRYSIKVDLWSIGIILFEMLYGRTPYRAKTHYQLLQMIDTKPIIIPKFIKISDVCRDLIHRLLQKDPAKRMSWDEFFNHPWIRDTTPLFTRPSMSKRKIKYSDKNMNISEPVISKETDYDEKGTLYLTAKSSEELSFDLLYEDEDSVEISINVSCENILDGIEEDYFASKSPTPETKPIAIPISEPPLITEDSPMFTTPLECSFTKRNGYVIVRTPTADECEENGGKSLMRSLASSFVSYMNNSINMFKTIY